MSAVPPVIALVGPHNSVKTRLLYRLVERAAAAGIRVGVLKCAARPLQFEPAGKDSARLADADAVRVVTAGAGRTMMMEHSSTRPSVRALSRRFGRDLDLWLVESYAPESVPWVRVARAGQHVPALDEDCVATIGVRGGSLPHFRHDRPAALWRFLVERMEVATPDAR